MAYINDLSFDAALNYIVTNGTRLHICSSEPASAAAAITASLGNKATITIGSPTDRTPTGRKVVVPAITDGSVTANGTATHYAIINIAGSILVATGQLSSSQSVTSGNTFTLAAFDIGFPDAV
jgi:hypothetical protein